MIALATGASVPELPLTWPELGASALLGMFVLAILTGRLIPRRTYDDKVHEANEWRAESRIKDQQIAEKDTQLRHMGEVGRTVDAIMHSLKSRNHRTDDEVPQ